MKTITEANGLMSNITSSKFLCAFCVCREVLGYTKPLCVQLQKSSIEVVQAYNAVSNVIDTLQEIRENSDDNFKRIVNGPIQELSEIGNSPITIPRRCGRQTARNNTPAESAE